MSDLVAVLLGSRCKWILTLITGLALLTLWTAPSAPAATPLKVSAKPIAKPLAANRFLATRVVIKNNSKRRLRGLTFSVNRARGVTIRLAGAKKGKLVRRLGALKPKGTARVTIRLRRAKRGPKRGQLRLRVKRGKRVLANGRLRFGAKAPKPVTSDPNSLAGRYFWGSTYTISGIRQNTLYFTGKDLVYTEAAEEAWPSCTAVTEACRPYAYDAKSGKLTIDGKAATLEGLELTFDDETYREWGFPPAGTRWNTVVTYSNSSGVCPLFCSYYTEHLHFNPDGTFVRSAVSSGTGPVVDWSSIPPDSKGTYEVRADHTLRMAFADGTERIETVALYLKADGSLEAPGEGILLGGDGYFDIRD